MDKFCAQNLCGMAKTILTVLIFLFSGNSGVVAQDSVWSFKDNPHPVDGKLLEPEVNPEKGTVADLLALKVACESLLDEQYLIYRELYPDFENSGDSESNLKNWETHLLTSADFACPALIPFVQLTSSYDDELFADFYFCGSYSRPAETALEREAAVLIDDLFDYAQLGEEALAFLLIAAGMTSGVVELNPDVEYYFSRLLGPVMEFDTQRPEITRPEQMLSDERKAFVEEAAERLDLQSVLDTTQPCAQR